VTGVFECRLEELGGEVGTDDNGQPGEHLAASPGPQADRADRRQQDQQR
jgi:hypothetical protein